MKPDTDHGALDQTRTASAGTSSDLSDWLRLNRAFINSPSALAPLLKQHGTADAIWSALTQPEYRRQGARLMRALSSADADGVQRDMDWLAAPGRHLLTWADDDYPPLLRELPVPPCVLFLAGNRSLLQQPQIAVVGSRRPSLGGKRVAARLAGELAACGLVVSSGMAIGIDAEAHAAVLKAKGATLAVLGSGLARPYPAHADGLYHRLVQCGAVISEFPTDMAPLPGNFPRRNRLISGLTLGTVVVEATERSGSLITARQALEQGKEVFAVPGPVDSPTSRGCHLLLRQGAKLVESAVDVLEEIAPVFTPPRPPPAATAARADDAVLTPPLQRILPCVDYQATGLDDIVEASGLTAAQVSSMLCILEIKGFVVTQWDGRYIRVR